MKLLIPRLLAFNGGYVDAAGFLALQGLFTAHVTGNFVTLGVTLVHGSSGVLAKLLALPLFCAVVLVAHYFSQPPSDRVLKTLLIIKLLLFSAAAVMAIELGPFTDGDSGPAVLTGLTMVAAMAIQNGVHHVYFHKAPPSTLMTGTTTQIMMDVADTLRADISAELRRAAFARGRSMFVSVFAFVAGCAAAALIYAYAGMPVFVLPPIVTAFTLWSHLSAKPQAATVA